MSATTFANLPKVAPPKPRTPPRRYAFPKGHIVGIPGRLDVYVVCFGGDNYVNLRRIGHGVPTREGYAFVPGSSGGARIVQYPTKDLVRLPREIIAQAMKIRIHEQNLQGRRMIERLTYDPAPVVVDPKDWVKEAE